MHNKIVLKYDLLTSTSISLRITLSAASSAASNF